MHPCSWTSPSPRRSSLLAFVKCDHQLACLSLLISDWAVLILSFPAVDPQLNYCKTQRYETPFKMPPLRIKNITYQQRVLGLCKKKMVWWKKSESKKIKGRENNKKEQWSFVLNNESENRANSILQVQWVTGCWHVTNKNWTTWLQPFVCKSSHVLASNVQVINRGH